jgi:hypothetical protein
MAFKDGQLNESVVTDPHAKEDGPEEIVDHDTTLAERGAQVSLRKPRVVIWCLPIQP